MREIQDFTEKIFSSFLQCIMISITYDHVAEYLEGLLSDTWLQISPLSNRQQGD